MSPSAFLTLLPVPGNWRGERLGEEEGQIDLTAGLDRLDARILNLRYRAQSIRGEQ